MQETRISPTEYTVARGDITGALEKTLQPLPYVYAMWQGGAAAWGRVDEWSDLDVQMVVEDDRIEECFMTIERTLTSLGPIDLEYEIPQPAWHGHAQKFYRLADASPFLLLDLVLMKHSVKNQFIQPEMHGNPFIHFDKAGLLKPEPFDQEAHRNYLKKRRAELRIIFDLFQTLTLKELHRHNNIEAISFYFGHTLRPLVELLRIAYAPERYNFHTRYVYYDLPQEIVERLEPLFFIRDGNDLRTKREAAEKLFLATDGELNL